MKFLRLSRRKKQISSPFRAFLSRAVGECLSKCPNSKKTPLPKKLLVTRLNEINKNHHSIKFDFEFSKEKIEFLETLVYKDHKNRLQATLYKKPTNHQDYLHTKPAHPLSLRKSIPYSEALRIKRVCSTFNEYKKYSNDLIKKCTKETSFETKSEK